MSILGDIFGNGDDNKKESDDDDKKLRLHKEELDIAKNNVKKGEVELGKEIIEEHKAVDVPVKHEEVVIERKSLNNEASDTPIGDSEAIKIPVSEEKVDVGKHTVVTGEVSAHKRAIEDTEHIDETLKHEEARINTVGDPNVVDEGTDQQ
ncbi:YsnF/AvaK domain-containing protein [Clostridium guangxiense]|uniref:YsnF/AvaK domain-containing protein n=1 Tax=Clostridium guangxiense TaxID=1662055 RepID=UPI001E5C2A7D|nr:YsnF/AvaK domain-containing protein [Clostridium guangxiense]MCD2349027.1 YsnF/AvaK domain-containing protein [Clostridium guangxiense]